MRKHQTNILFLKKLTTKLCFLAVLFLLILIPISKTHAGFFSFVSDFFSGDKQEETGDAPKNSQNIPLLRAAVNVDLSLPKGGGDIVVVGGTALLPETGPSGTIADINEGYGTQISAYVVRPGDTLSAISKMFGVSVQTIIGGNSIQGGMIQPGQILVIFPISGLQYTVKSGDTLENLAKKYKADAEEIIQYNNLAVGVTLKAGETIFIPDAELPALSPSIGQSRVWDTAGPSYEGYYMRPVLVGKRTQGLHGYNGVDLAAPAGTPVFAAAGGDVMISRNYGWNGGYGYYIVITHSNGTQTLYGHLSATVVYEGYRIVRGQLIGYVGSTGKSTGSHLHFEVRGARNPF